LKYKNRIEKFYKEGDMYAGFDQMESAVPPSHPAEKECLSQVEKACVNCGSKDDLRGFAHGNKFDEMIGVLIFCKSCHKMHLGKKMTVNVEFDDKN